MKKNERFEHFGCFRAFGTFLGVFRCFWAFSDVFSKRRKVPSREIGKSMHRKLLRLFISASPFMDFGYMSTPTILLPNATFTEEFVNPLRFEVMDLGNGEVALRTSTGEH